MGSTLNSTITGQEGIFDDNLAPGLDLQRMKAHIMTHRMTIRLNGRVTMAYLRSCCKGKSRRLN